MPLSRANLEQRVVRRLHRGGGANADVSLVRVGERECVVKDYAVRSRWWRRTLAGWLVRRELRAYRQLEGLSELPRLLGVLDELAFVIEYRPGRPLSRSLSGQLGDRFVPALERAVTAMHERGVVHLDLRHRSNVLADANGLPVLIDFASALCFEPGGVGARWLVPLFGCIDRLALRKWRKKLSS